MKTEDLIPIALIGAVGLGALTLMRKGGNGGAISPPSTIVIPSLTPPVIQDGDPQAPPVVLPPITPPTPTPIVPSPVPPTPSEDPEAPAPPEEAKPSVLPPVVPHPDAQTDLGKWMAQSLLLGGAKGGVQQHLAKWGAEKNKRLQENPDRPGKLWNAYYGLTSSPAASWLGSKLGL